MSKDQKHTVRTDLTETHKKAQPEKVNQEDSTVEFNVEELEQRIAPRSVADL